MLRHAFRRVRKERPFHIGAIVGLPGHLYTVWTLPEGDKDCPAIWKLLKSQFLRELRRIGAASPQNERGQYLIWQRRYWEHAIRDTEDLQRHIDHIHYNPVKHSLVSRFMDQPYSSFHLLVKQGVVPTDWARGGESDERGRLGK